MDSDGRPDDLDLAESQLKKSKVSLHVEMSKKSVHIKSGIPYYLRIQINVSAK